MFRSLNVLKDFVIHATDGALGGVSDIYFDDASWTVRYLVVDTGTWLTGRKVLLPASVLGKPDPARNAFPVDLTKDQVKESPDIDTDKPVSRQHEAQIYGYYGWTPYWGAGLWAPGAAGYGLGAVPPPVAPAPAEAIARETERGDPHLRSGREVVGYYIGALDGDIGHVEDLLMDDADWRIRYLLVDTRNWLPGRKVVLAVDWVESIDWASRTVRVGTTQEKVKGSPEFDEIAEIDRAYEEGLYAYYGQPPYWTI